MALIKQFWPTWIGVCCREWEMAFGFGGGKCGICGQSPVYLRQGPGIEVETQG